MDPLQAPPTFSWPEWLRQCHQAIEGKGGIVSVVDSDRAPTGEQRKIIRNRIGELQPWIIEATQEEKAAIVTQLLLAFPMQSSGETAATYRAKAYLDALHDVPAWAIDAGRRDWQDGKARDLGGGRPDFRFAPSPPVFRMYAVAHANIAWSEHYRLREILNAKIRKVPTKKQRARMAARLGQLSADLAESMAVDKSSEAQRQAERRARLQLGDIAKEAAK
ncbi:MAG: hypothetical protein OEQ29_01735 [Alphaproteobacteria bacterium]|nr:hypothetical protein [Alphaproteobacteria bacterium]